MGERESSEFKRNLNGGPLADDGGEQVLIIRTSFILSGAHQATQVSDERLLITDFVHTENTEGNGGPQADCFGETAIAINDQQLKEKSIYPRRTRKMIDD